MSDSNLPELPLERALAIVGPGWRRLIEMAYDITREHGGLYVMTVSRRRGRLVVSHWARVWREQSNWRRVSGKLRALSLTSSVTCESCGSVGTLDLGHPGAFHTLCPACGFRLREGGITWTEVQGEWTPDEGAWSQQNDDEDDYDDGDDDWGKGVDDAAPWLS